MNIGFIAGITVGAFVQLVGMLAYMLVMGWIINNENNENNEKEL